MSANGRRRAVITGLGAVTPLASDVATSWERLIGGRSAAGLITAFDPLEFMMRRVLGAEESHVRPTRRDSCLTRLAGERPSLGRRARACTSHHRPSVRLVRPACGGGSFRRFDLRRGHAPTALDC